MKKSVSILLFCISIFNHISYCQWVQVTNGIGSSYSLNSLCASNSSIFTGHYSYGVFRTTNNGENWINVTNGISTGLVNDLIAIDSNIFVSFDNGGVYRSTNNGNNWVYVYSGLTSPFVWKLAAHNNILFGGLYSYGTGFDCGIFRTTNYGNNWYNVSTGLPIYETINSFTVSGQYVYASCNKGVYRTSNDGGNWYSCNSGMSDSNIKSLGTNGIYIFASTAVGIIYRSSDNGLNWFVANNGLQNNSIYTFTSSGNNLFAGGNGVFLSTNNGVNWINRNQGFSVAPNIRRLLIAGNYIYAATSYYSVWRRNLSDILETKSSYENITSTFLLYDNYPNPFNPVTNIKYQIPKNTNVIIKVFDIAGRETETLIDKKQNPGVYNIKFDGSNYPSGVYFYRMTADGYIETKKMILLK